MAYPRIIPTPSGYNFARLIDEHLRSRYLPEREIIDAKPWVDTEVVVFADTGSITKIHENIRKSDAYIIADVQNAGIPLPLFEDGNEGHQIMMCGDRYSVLQNGVDLPTVPMKLKMAENVDMLCSTIDAARNAVKENGSVTVVVPFMPSSRQDRREGRSSLDLKRHIMQMEAAGADHVLTIDVHNPATESMFNGRTGFDNLYAAKTLLKYLRGTMNLSRAHPLSPDPGALNRNLMYARELKAPVGSLYKEHDHSKPNTLLDDVHYMGDPRKLKDRDVLIVDDMIDKARTGVRAVNFAHIYKPRSIRLISTHPVFSKPAIQRLSELYTNGTLTEVIVTNSIYRPEEFPWLKKIDVSPYFAKTIDRLSQGESISELLREMG